LDVRSSHTLNVGTILNVDREQFVNVTVIVDPPAQGRPGGEIWESNEEDNICTAGIYTALASVPDIPTSLELSEDEPLEPPEPPIRQQPEAKPGQGGPPA